MKKIFIKELFLGENGLTGYTYNKKILGILGLANNFTQNHHIINNGNNITPFFRLADLNRIKLEQAKLKKELQSKEELARAYLIEKKYYKGVRYAKNLPARGQRTHTNAKTSRKNINKK